MFLIVLSPIHVLNSQAQAQSFQRTHLYGPRHKIQQHLFRDAIAVALKACALASHGQAVIAFGTSVDHKA